MSGNNCKDCYHWMNEPTTGIDHIDNDPNLGACDEINSMVGFSLTGNDDNVSLDTMFTRGEFTCGMFKKKHVSVSHDDLLEWDDLLKGIHAVAVAEAKHIGQEGDKDTAKKIRRIALMLAAFRNKLREKLV